MKKTDFVTAQQAKVLAELGFNEPCLTSYTDRGVLNSPFNLSDSEAEKYASYRFFLDLPDSFYCYNSELKSGFVAAPLIQQAQEWIESQLFGLCVFRYGFDGDSYSFALWDLDCNVVEDWSSSYNTKQEAIFASIDHYLQVIKEVRGVV